MHRRTLCKSISIRSSSYAAMAAMLMAGSIDAPAHAEKDADHDKGAQGSFADEIIVTAGQSSTEGLRGGAGVATGLGLEAIETPASLDIVDLDDQTRFGFRTIAEATKGVAGLTFTTRSGAPGVFQSRGFTENALVTLNDGIRIQSATITARALDPFHYERVEVLRGPSSLLYGEGATAGAINYVRRKPRLGDARIEVLGEGGTQGRARLGVAASGTLGGTIGATLSASYQRLGSFADGVDSQTVQVVGGIGGNLAEDTAFLIEGDHFSSRVDDAYWGQPLLNGAIDLSLRNRNFNRSPNNRMADDVTWLRGVVTHQFSDALDYRGQVYGYQADRDWRNFYAFRVLPTDAALIEARNVESLGYDHQFWGTRHDLRV